MCSGFLSGFLIFGLGFAGQMHIELFEHTLVNRRKKDRRVYLAAFQKRERSQCAGRIFIGSRADGERNEYLVGVKTGILASEVICF